MSEVMPVRGVVVGHGGLAAGLIDAVRQIVGDPGDGLVALSNAGRAPETVLEDIRRTVEGSPAIVFVDLPSGSCAIAARRYTREATGVPVVCGVNLPMLLDFATHRDMPVEALVERLVERGRAAIVAPASRESHGDPAVSRR